MAQGWGQLAEYAYRRPAFRQEDKESGGISRLNEARVLVHILITISVNNEGATTTSLTYTTTMHLLTIITRLLLIQSIQGRSIH